MECILFLFVRLDNAFFEDDVCVDGGFARGDDGVCLLRAVVEVEAGDEALSEVIILRPCYHKVVRPDCGGRVAVCRLHQEEVFLRIGVKRYQIEDCIEQFSAADAVGTDNPLSAGFGREVCIGDNNLVTVTHLGKYFQKCGGDKR